MKKTVAIITFAVAAFAVQAADQTISFNNNNLGTARLVTWDSTFGALSGQGVKNATADGASYVAQLFIQAGDGSLSAVGATANFRGATTTSPGTWSGGTRTATGVNQGTALNLVVRVWDNSVASYDTARASFGKGYGQSAAFAFQDPLGSPPGPSDNFMVNFQGFSVTQNVIPEPSTIALGALGVAGLLFFRRK
jgi:hypothetical protein